MRKNEVLDGLTCSVFRSLILIKITRTLPSSKCGFLFAIFRAKSSSKLKTLTPPSLSGNTGNRREIIIIEGLLRTIPFIADTVFRKTLPLFDFKFLLLLPRSPNGLCTLHNKGSNALQVLQAAVEFLAHGCWVWPDLLS